MSEFAGALPAPTGTSPRPDDVMAQHFAAAIGAGSAGGCSAAWPLDALHPYVFQEGRWTASRPLLEQRYRCYREGVNAPDIWQTNASIEAVMKRMRSEPGVAVAADAFDQDPYLMGVGNGVLNLRTGKVSPGEPGHYVSRFAAVYDPRHEPGRLGRMWIDGLAWALDADTVGWLQSYLGAALLGFVPIKGFLYLRGEGNSGKSTLTTGVLKALGDYATTGSKDLVSTTVGGKERDRFAVKHTLGRRLVVIPEMTGRQELDEGLVKAFTGESSLSVRVMREDAYEAANTASLVLQGNTEAARAAMGDEAFAGRLRIVPFRRRRAGTDDGGMQLFHAMSASEDVHRTVLKWLVRGCLEFQAEGEAPLSDAMRAEADAYADENDPVGVWLRESGVAATLPETGNWPWFSDVRRAYEQWRMDNEGVQDARLLRPAVNAKMLGGALKQAGIEHGTTGGRSRFRLNVEKNSDKPSL